jgi:putative tricarboxylic transport membrane protein
MLMSGLTRIAVPLLGLVLLAAAPADAADWKPTSPVQVIVHAGPGGGNDIFGRAMLTIMDKEGLLPVRFSIINKTGGGSANARNYLIERKGDDNTIGLFTSTYLIDPLVAEADTASMFSLTPIAGLVFEPALVVVRADSPFKTLADFIDAAKASPNKYKQSAGNARAREGIVRALLMAKTGAQWSYISFPSAGERISNLLGGHTDLMMIEPSEESGLIRSGKLRALAQISTTRLPSYPDLPTLKEAGFDITDVPQARGVVGPPGMSKEAVDFYADLFKRAIATEGWKKYLGETQLESAYMDPQQLTTFVKTYTDDIREVLKSIGVKVVR